MMRSDVNDANDVNDVNDANDRHDDDSSMEQLNRGLQFLADSQLPTGQFPVEVTFHYKGDEKLSDGTIFATAHIVYALGHLPLPTVRPMIERALSYLRAQMSWSGLWHYWNKDAAWDRFKLHPYIPADLDDMASVSYLLRRYQVPFPDNRYLFYLNRDKDKRFYTWLVFRPTPTLNLRYWGALFSDISPLRYTLFWKASEAGYNDVDGVVNANAVLYLGQNSGTLPTIQWLIQIVREGREAVCDKWYRDPFTFYYALSRAYAADVQALGAVCDLITERITEHQGPDGRIGANALQTALAINTLFNFYHGSENAPARIRIGRDIIKRAIPYLLETQEAEGCWPVVPYYYGGPQKSVSWGGRELTTAICLEAICRNQSGVFRFG